MDPYDQVAATIVEAERTGGVGVRLAKVISASFGFGVVLAVVNLEDGGGNISGVRCMGDVTPVVGQGLWIVSTKDGKWLGIGCTTWSAPWQSSWGIYTDGFVESDLQGTTSAGAELTLLTTAAITIAASRRTRVSARWSFRTQTVATDIFHVRLVSSVAGNITNDPCRPIAADYHDSVWDVSALAAGAHTFTLRTLRAAGTGTETIGGGGAGNGRFMQLIVEDVGPV